MHKKDLFLRYNTSSLAARISQIITYVHYMKPVNTWIIFLQILHRLLCPWWTGIGMNIGCEWCCLWWWWCSESILAMSPATKISPMPPPWLWWWPASTRVIAERRAIKQKAITLLLDNILSKKEKHTYLGNFKLNLYL